MRLGFCSVFLTIVSFLRDQVQIQEFSFVRGGPGQTDKKSSDVFFSPQLILQKSNGQFQRNLSFFMVPEWVQHFPGVGGGGSNFFQVGPIAYSL